MSRSGGGVLVIGTKPFTGTGLFKVTSIRVMGAKHLISNSFSNSLTKKISFVFRAHLHGIGIVEVFFFFFFFFHSFFLFFFLRCSFYTIPKVKGSSVANMHLIFKDVLLLFNIHHSFEFFRGACSNLVYFLSFTFGKDSY
ncbi:hypothetical protein HMI54_014447 [Coelomomyces lativittatus]|nr:hypothetical protein HMI54_014447 [Coelomomyces lativittatus]